MSLSRKKWFRLMAHTYRSVGYGVHYSTAVIFGLKHSVAFFSLQLNDVSIPNCKYFCVSRVVAVRFEPRLIVVVLTLVIVQLFFSSFQ